MNKALSFPILKELGLAENEALIYELLLKLGTSKAVDLVDPSGIGRGNVYNVLKTLQSKGLVLALEGAQTRFQAVEPSKLQDLLNDKIKAAKALESTFSAALPGLISAFNLSTGKPAVQIFEGLEGYKKALESVLTSSEEILTYVDINALRGQITQLDEWFEQKRNKLDLHQKLIVTDTPETRAVFTTATPGLEVKFIKEFPNNFNAALEIFDKGLAYLTFTNGFSIAVVIQDQSIVQLHRQMFYFMWNHTGSSSQAQPPSNRPGAQNPFRDVRP